MARKTPAWTHVHPQGTTSHGWFVPRRFRWGRFIWVPFARGGSLAADRGPARRLFWHLYYIGPAAGEGVTMAWTIRAVEFARATRGWRCEVAFRVRTQRQCTMEDHAVYDGAAGHGPLSILLAYWRGLRAMRRECARLRAIPGPWTLDGKPAAGARRAP